jgi:hypothetical protein
MKIYVILFIIIFISCSTNEIENYSTSEYVKIEETETIKQNLNNVKEKVIEEIYAKNDELIKTEEEILTDLSHKIFSAIQNKDFITIKEYVNTNTFDFFWWKIKTDSLEKYDFSSFKRVEMEQCPGCGDIQYYTAYKYLNGKYFNDEYDYSKIDSNKFIFHSNINWIPNNNDSIVKNGEYLYYGSLNKKINDNLDFDYRMVRVFNVDHKYPRHLYNHPILIFKNKDENYSLIGIYDFSSEYYN